MRRRFMTSAASSGFRIAQTNDLIENTPQCRARFAIELAIVHATFASCTNSNSLT